MWGAKGLLGVVLVVLMASSELGLAADLQRCLWEASAYYQVNPNVLAAIVEVESRWQPWAIGYKEQGRVRSVYPDSREEAERLIERLWREGRSFDVGLGQINHQHLRAFKLTDPTVLLDPCVNLYWAAYVLKLKMNRYGNTWTAVERYNGINPRYPERVRRVLEEWEVWP